MEIKNARVLQVLPVEQGESARGAWQKQTIVFEYGDQYPQNIAVEFFNKPQVASQFYVGGVFDVSIQPTSREHNGRWYSQIGGWKATPVGQPQYAQQPSVQQQYVQAPPQQQQYTPPAPQPQYAPPAPQPQQQYTPPAAAPAPQLQQGYAPPAPQQQYAQPQPQGDNLPF